MLFVKNREFGFLLKRFGISKHEAQIFNKRRMQTSRKIPQLTNKSNTNIPSEHIFSSQKQLFFAIENLRHFSGENKDKQANSNHSTNESQQKSNTHSNHSNANKGQNRRVGLLLTSMIIAIVGLSYAAVPLYRMFCQVTGYGGATKRTLASDLKEKRKNTQLLKPITIFFNADVSSNLDWEFKPVQTKIIVQPGESALAFFHAKNNTKSSIVGVATYNVSPPQVSNFFSLSITT